MVRESPRDAGPPPARGYDLGEALSLQRREEQLESEARSRCSRYGPRSRLGRYISPTRRASPAASRIASSATPMPGPASEWTCSRRPYSAPSGKAKGSVARRVVAQLRVLHQPLDCVDPEAVHAAVHPEPDHVAHRFAHRGLAPVEVGLLGVEGVQVVAARALVERPRRARRTRPPSCSAARPPTCSTRGAPGTSGARSRCGTGRSRAGPSGPGVALATRRSKPSMSPNSGRRRMSPTRRSPCRKWARGRSARARARPPRVRRGTRAATRSRPDRRSRRRRSPGRSADRSGRRRRRPTSYLMSASARKQQVPLGISVRGHRSSSSGTFIRRACL